MPLSHIRRTQVRIQCKELGCVWVRKRAGGKALGKESQAGNRAIVDTRRIGIREAAGLIESLGHQKGRIKSLARVRVRTVFLSSIENAETAAKDQARGDGIGKADARRKVVQIRIN